MNIVDHEEWVRVVSYLVLIYFTTKRLKKNEDDLRQRKGFNRVPAWMFNLTFWNVLGGCLFFTFVIASTVFATALTDKYLRSHLPAGFLTNELPNSFIILSEASICLWLGFTVGKFFWKTWAGFKLSLWDFSAFTYYAGFVLLLSASLLNFTEKWMVSYVSTGTIVNVLVSLLVILLECSLLAWLTFEGWLRIWGTIQDKGKLSNG